MAAATPTGPNPNSLLVRAIAGLSVVVALIGVIAVFTRGSGSSSPSGQPTPGATAPSTTPTPSHSPRNTPTPTATPTTVPTGTAAPTPASSAPTSVTTSPPRGVASTPVPAQTTTNPPPGHTGPPIVAPAVGSYQYATTGGEQTSFPGTARRYPATTTIKITKAGCGVDQTWTPISQHSETEQLCIVNNQVHLASYSTTISFFGQTITQKFTCGNDAFIYSPTLQPGQTWSFTCTGNGTKVTQHLKAIGFQTLDVGNTQIRTIHINVSSKISGSNGGSTDEDYWIQTGTHPFVIRNTAQVQAKNGAITYSEAYSIQLKQRP